MDNERVLLCNIKTAEEMRLLGNALGRYLSSVPKPNDGLLSSRVISIHGPAETGKTTLVEGIVESFQNQPLSLAQWDKRFPLEKMAGNQLCQFIDYGTRANPLSLASPQKIMRQMEESGDFEPFAKGSEAYSKFLEHSTYPGTLLADTNILMGNFETRPADTKRYYEVLRNAFEYIAGQRPQVMSDLINRAMASKKEGVLRDLGVSGHCPKAMKKQVNAALETEKSRIRDVLEQRKGSMETVLFSQMKSIECLPFDQGAVHAASGHLVCIVNTSSEIVTRQAFGALKQFAHANFPLNLN